MLLKEHCHTGMQVKFGRPGGEKTLCKIIKMNYKKVKVQTLETRHCSQGYIGTVWNVPYALLWPAGEVKVIPLKYDPDPESINSALLWTIYLCYKNSQAHHLSKLFQILGRVVSEEEAIKWAGDKKTHELSGYEVETFEED